MHNNSERQNIDWQKRLANEGSQLTSQQAEELESFVKTTSDYSGGPIAAKKIGISAMPYIMDTWFWVGLRCIMDGCQMQPNT